MRRPWASSSSRMSKIRRARRRRPSRLFLPDGRQGVDVEEPPVVDLLARDPPVRDAIRCCSSRPSSRSNLDGSSDSGVPASSTPLNAATRPIATVTASASFEVRPARRPALDDLLLPMTVGDLPDRWCRAPASSERAVMIAGQLLQLEVVGAQLGLEPGQVVAEDGDVRARRDGQALLPVAEVERSADPRHELEVQRQLAALEHVPVVDRPGPAAGSCRAAPP